MTAVEPTVVADRVAAVRDQVAEACARAGRSTDEVTIVAVTKTHPVEVVRAAVDAGLTDVGESYVQELLEKAASVGRDVRWHLVGRLQSNKARDVVGRVALVHAVDRLSLASELGKRARRAGVVQPVLVQVNVGDDPAKAGVGPDRALAFVGRVAEVPGLALAGLTTIPPLPPDGVDPVGAARPYFSALRGLRDRVRRDWPQVSELSMGMSADFVAAVEEGATMVRLGTALFGPRRQ